MDVRLENLLDFSFQFTIDNVRWWLFVIWTVGVGLVILGEEIHMKYRVNLH